MELLRTDLCKLALKYKTDKVKDYRHNYTPLYHQLLKDKRETAEVFMEIGIGHRGRDIKNPNVFNMMHVQDYVIGASLYMWQDYFTKAKIYGLDIHPDCMFVTDRISTALVDQSNAEALRALVEQTVQKPLDIVIDDGSHVPADQVASLVVLAPYLNPSGGIYIIEDVSPALYNHWHAFFTPEVMARLASVDCTVEKYDLRAENPGVEDDYVIVVKRNKAQAGIASRPVLL